MTDNQNSLENQKAEERKVIQAVPKKEDDKRVCPFLTMPVMTQKQTMINGKVVSLPEAQLKINQCIKGACMLYNSKENKCGLVK